MTLGAGNEGVVFRGLLNGDSVAVKLFKPDASGRRERRTRALVRLNLSSTLSASVAGPFEELSWEDRVGHVAPLVPGISIQDLVDAPAQLTPRQRTIAVIKLGALVAALHRRGLAFGDLNKGAVKLEPRSDGDVQVSLVDLDSAVLPGESESTRMNAVGAPGKKLRRRLEPLGALRFYDEFASELNAERRRWFDFYVATYTRQLLAALSPNAGDDRVLSFLEQSIILADKRAMLATAGPVIHLDFIAHLANSQSGMQHALRLVLREGHRLQSYGRNVVGSRAQAGAVHG